MFPDNSGFGLGPAKKNSLISIRLDHHKETKSFKGAVCFHFPVKL